MKRGAIRSLLSGLVAGMMSVASPFAFGAEGFGSYNGQGNPGDNYTAVVDFSSTAIPVGLSGSLSGKKYWELSLGTFAGKSQCFNIATSGAMGIDTQVWAYSPTANDYVILNENSTNYAAARVWLKPSTGGSQLANLVVTSNSGSQAFQVGVSKVTAGTTLDACKSGSTHSTYSKSTSSGNTTITFYNIH